MRMPAMAEKVEKKRKRPSSDQPKTPAKKPSLLTPSSPLAPLPKSTIRPLLNRPEFNRIEGLPFSHKIQSELPQNAFDLFALFCTESMVESWAHFVNIRRDEPAWQPTFKEEIYLFFGVLLYMSFCILPSMDSYWEISKTTASHPITRFITRDRFLAIYRRFCTWDPTLPISSVFEKVKPWSSHIQDTSAAFWRPSSNISVDEAMVRFTGRSKDIVHLPNKPISVGYKIWVVADSGYFLRWIFHSKDKGPIGYTKSQYPELAPTQGIVAKLLMQLPPPPSPLHSYHCFMDNLFATPPLFRRLRDNNIAATGTTRPNRIDSKQLLALKSTEKTKDHVLWGTVFARKHRDEDVMQFGFKDNAFVLLLSTAFDGWEPSVERLRRQPSKSSTSAKTARQPFEGQATKLLDIPHFIDAYNHNMNGVDIGDQLRAGYTSKWRLRRGGQQALLYLFLLGVAVTNSYLLQRNSWPSPVKSMGAFRQRLCTEIIERFGAKVALQVNGQATPESIKKPHKATKREARLYCAFCSSKKRNWLINQEYLPTALPQKHKIITGCDACNVNLCDNSKKRCFQLWHDALEKSGGM